MVWPASKIAVNIFAKPGFLASALAVCVPAQAQKFENLDRLDSIVAMTVGANIGEPGGPVAPVDRRLKLAACPEVPQVSGPVFSAAMVECKSIGWRIRVPLRAGGANHYNRSAQAVAKAKATPLIKRGDPVQLVAGGTSFTVSRIMIADEDGVVGDMIRVREDRRSDPVLAQIVEDGMVRIPGFKDF